MANKVRVKVRVELKVRIKIRVKLYHISEVAGTSIFLKNSKIILYIRTYYPRNTKVKMVKENRMAASTVIMCKVACCAVNSMGL